MQYRINSEYEKRRNENKELLLVNMQKLFFFTVFIIPQISQFVKGFGKNKPNKIFRLPIDRTQLFVI